MGSSQSSIVNKLSSNRAADVTEALRLLKAQLQNHKVFDDSRFFRAVLPPLAAVLAVDNRETSAKLAAFRDLSCLATRPAAIGQDQVAKHFGECVEALLVAPIVLALFAQDQAIRKAAGEAIDVLSRNQSLFGATEFATTLLEYMSHSTDEAAKVRLLPALWMAGTHLMSIHRPLYTKVLHILLIAERNVTLRAQIIAEFRRILHEEPTVLDAHTSQQLFTTLRTIIANHNPSEVDVVVDFAYGCMLKLIPQRRSVLGNPLLKSLADVAAATLSQPLVAPQYLDINTSLIKIFLDACDEGTTATIAAACVQASRHFAFVLTNRSILIDEPNLLRLATSVLTCFATVTAWSALPGFANWSSAFYRGLSITLVVALLSGHDSIASQATALLGRCAILSGAHLQYFVGDLSLLFVIFVARLLHPTRLKSLTSAQPPAPLAESQQPCAAIVEELYSLPTTADRQHRIVKDKLQSELLFLADYPLVVMQQSALDGGQFSKFQIDVWTNLNIVRAAVYHILSCLMRVCGKSQHQLVELLTIWYDRMAFSGHFVLVDVLNKALMSILVKMEGGAVVGLPGQTSPPPYGAPYSLKLHADDPINTNVLRTSIRTSPSSSILATNVAAPSSQSSSVLMSYPVASSSSSNLSTITTAGQLAASGGPLSSVPSPASPTAAPSFPFSPTSPAPRPVSTSPDLLSGSVPSERFTDLQRRYQEMEREMKAISLERAQLASQLNEKVKEATALFNDKEQLLSQIACAVCLENILDNKPICLECGHLFCGPCVDNVMRSSQKCPLCKTAITKYVQVKGL